MQLIGAHPTILSVLTMIHLRSIIFTRAKDLPAWNQLCVDRSEQRLLREKITLRPNNAMYWLTWGAAYRTDGEGLGALLGVAIIAFRSPLLVISLNPIILALHEYTFLMTWTWPLKPVVPLSIKATSAAKHILFTCRRASILSRALKTRSKVLYQATLKRESLILAWWASSLMCGLNFPAVAFATWELCKSARGQHRRTHSPYQSFGFLDMLASE